MKKIIARTIVQMMGSPKEHIKKTMNIYMDQLKDKKGLKILEEHRAKPKKEGDMYKIFTELEIEFDKTSDLVWYCFDYMPSSVEIIEPGQIVYEAPAFTEFLNDLQQKLHKLDSGLQHLSAENQVIKKNGMTLMKNIILLQLKMKPLGIKTLAENAGAPEEHVQKFVDAMIKDGKIKKDGNVYKLA